MSLCTLCGHPAINGDALCSYHFASTGDDWATGNRIMCDFLHRGILLSSARVIPITPRRRPIDGPAGETARHEPPRPGRPLSMPFFEPEGRGQTADAEACLDVAL
jgi:hypothetical protein